MTSTALARPAPRLACTLMMALAALMTLAAAAAAAQEAPVADPGTLAFEEGRWEDVIAEYRAILAASPDDRLSRLRIAQAQRELGRHDEALETLEQARLAQAPEAMIELERLKIGRAHV